ncbi:MAG: hypothetical protein AAFY81_06785, partial [Pseudomonadota bacterium]
MTQNDGAAVGGDGSTESAPARPARATRISDDAKRELRDFFARVAGSWPSQTLPKSGGDPELDQLQAKHKLQRAQITRQFLAYKKAGGAEPVPFAASEKDVEASLTKRIGDVDAFVQESCENFLDGTFCMDPPMVSECKEPARDMVAACLDAIKVHVQSLVRRLIHAIASNSAKSWNAAGIMACQLAKARDDIRDIVKSTFVTDGQILEQTRLYYGDYPFGAQLLFCGLEDHVYTTLVESLADHERPFLEAADPLPETDASDRRAGLVYYLAGWLYFKVQRAVRSTGDDDHKPHWRQWLATNAITLDQAEARSLPFQLTRGLAAKRGARYTNVQLVVYASSELFDFVWAVEATYAKLLTTANLLAYGGNLVNCVQHAIESHEPTTRLFTMTFSEELRLQLTDGVVRDLMDHMLGAYHRMRGRDFIRSRMSNLRAAAVTQNRSAHRDKMAAVSVPPPAKRSKRSNPDEVTTAHAVVRAEHVVHEV